jgi:tetraacyldisaccharide 4'-kinase
MSGLTRFVVGQWHEPTLAGQILLRPLAWLFALLAATRRFGYRARLRRTGRLPVPVVVVGNLSVGGSGKTPLVAHLVRALAEAGFTPGIVSRGYGGREQGPRRLDAHATAVDSGDEPVWLAEVTGCPVAVGRDRQRAAQLLVADCNVIIADDGLQHYALGRDIEIAVIDGESGLGNGRLLPAGPLREPGSRLHRVDHVAVRDGSWPGARRYRVVADRARNLVDHRECSLATWSGKPVHAVAAIGVPGRFFAQLEDAGIDIARHAFADHHAFQPADLAFGDDRPILMTAKDAVKCRAFADPRMWAVSARVEDLDDLAGAVIRQLQSMGKGRGSTTA